MSNNYGYDEDLSEFVMEEYKRAKKRYEKKIQDIKRHKKDMKIHVKIAITI